MEQLDVSMGLSETSWWTYTETGSWTYNGNRFVPGAKGLVSLSEVKAYQTMAAETGSWTYSLTGSWGRIEYSYLT